MPERIVICRRRLTASADQVWTLVGDFGADWHPAILSIKTEDNGQVRVFKGSDGGTYREQLTYFSHSDRTLSYELLDGIDGARSYKARARVVSLETGGCEILWRADIEAEEARVHQIADGTSTILEAGADWMADADLPEPSVPMPIYSEPAEVTCSSIGDTPRLSWLSGSEGNAETLVLCLHGIGGNAENWRAQLERFGSDYCIAAWDMRGYGDSTLGFDPTQIDDYCADIRTILHASGAKSLILVGLSMGSWIATSFAMRHPDLLAGLVLAGGCTGMSEAGFEERESFRLARAEPLAQGQVPADFAPSVVEIIAGPKATPEQRTALQASMESIPAESYLDALNCFCKPLEKFNFSRITCPVLMVTGENDRLAPPQEIRAVSQRIHDASPAPNIRFEILQDAGHVCNLEDPEGFNALLEDFLRGCPSAKLKRGSKREENRRVKELRILDVAMPEFCQRGFEGAAMAVIAKKAGVSKPTLYQYFGDKEGLFTAVLEQGRAHLMTPLAPGSGSLVSRLWAFSWTYADFVLSPDMLSLARLILGEAGRRPDSAQAYHKAGPGKALGGLMEFVEGCVAEGELATDASDLAAQDLWSLILSGPRDYHLHHVDAQPDRKALERNIRHGLRVFLQVYATAPERDLAELDQMEVPLPVRFQRTGYRN